MVGRSPNPEPGDRYRLPSGRFVTVRALYPRLSEPAAFCKYDDGEGVTLTCLFLVRHARRLA